MSLADVRYTVLQVVNEVQRRMALTTTQNLTTNAFATKCVDFINDTVQDLSDFGNWQEVLATALVTAVSGQSDYSIQTSAAVKNIEDIFFGSQHSPLRNIGIQTMRIMTRTTATGLPTQYCIFGTDANGNPNLRVRPTPVQAQDGELFSVLYYIQPPRYTTSDSSTIIPFPWHVIVLGTLARAYLDESAGAPTDQYKQYYQDYLNARKESLNRFNFDSGWGVQFAPGRSSGYRRRR